MLAASARSGRLRSITGPPLDADSPLWAPDRSSIAFTRGGAGLRDDRTLGVFVIRPDGTGLRRLGRGYGPRWAPDSRQVAYVDPLGSADPADVSAQLRAGAIVVAGLDGSSRRVATGTAPAWSPDGTTFAFVRYTFARKLDEQDRPYTAVVASTLSLVSADGSGERALVTSDVTGGPLFAPRWAPDGSALAVSQRLTREESGENYDQLALIDPTTGAERLLNLFGTDEFRWSPNSQEILVNNRGIGAVNVATGAFRSIIEARHDMATDTTSPFVAWSPDGTRVAYTRCVSRVDAEPNCDVWTAAADGSDRRRVTRTPGVDGAVAWAP